MANTTKARQSKLVKLLLDPETTVGTYVALSNNSLTVPLTDGAAPAPTRGTVLIPRSDTHDGFAGGMDGVVGSVAWSYSINTELHGGDSALAAPYWLILLAACGHETSGAPDTPTAGNTRITITPSTDVIANWNPATNDHAPTTVSLSYIENHNQVADSVRRMRGCTGTASFSFTANERAAMTCSMVGLIENDTLLDVSDVDASAFGAIWPTAPYVVKAITLTVQDANGDPVNAYGLQSLEFNTGMETPDYTDPEETWGFGISPVILNAEPTLSFTFANTEDFDAYLANTFLAGEVFSIEVQFANSNSTLRFIFPRNQFDSYTRTDNGGISYFDITARCVRAPGSNSTYSIEYTFPTT